MSAEPTLSDVRAAAERIRPYARHTPVMTCATLDGMAGARLFFKCENWQKTGAFKFRGACNAVFSLSDDQARKGVATHSSGNHAQAVSLSARLRGIPAYIVMPRTASEIKKAAVRGYGGQITESEPTQEDREAVLARVAAATGATIISPYNDYRVIAAQGTVALELLEDVRDLDVAVAPVSGGGLLAGVALTVAALSPRTRVIGAEPEGDDDAYRSLKAGRILPPINPRTIADGLLGCALGTLNFPIIQRNVSQIVTVSEHAIVDAMRLVWERAKILIEPSAAVPVAAVLERKLDLSGLRIGVVLSGGNVNLDKLPWATGSH